MSKIVALKTDDGYIPLPTYGWGYILIPKNRVREISENSGYFKYRPVVGDYVTLLEVAVHGEKLGNETYLNSHYHPHDPRIAGYEEWRTESSLRDVLVVKKNIDGIKMECTYADGSTSVHSETGVGHW